MPYQSKRFVNKDVVYKETSGKQSLAKADINTDEKILEQAKDLESVLVSTMIEPMFPEGKESRLYGGGQGNNVYRSLMIQEYGKILSKNNGLGIAEGIVGDLHK